MNNIYVGNFPYTTTEDDLSELFSRFGKVVRSVIITDHESGRSKGFGFVEFDNPDSAIRAKTDMNGFDYNGRPLRVNDATPRAPKPTTPAPAKQTGSAPHTSAPATSPNVDTLDDDTPPVDRPARTGPIPSDEEEIVSRGYRNDLLGISDKDD